MSVVCCQVGVPASGLSLIQRNSTACGVSECDREALDNEQAMAVTRWKETKIKTYDKPKILSDEVCRFY